MSSSTVLQTDSTSVFARSKAKSGTLSSAFSMRVDLLIDDLGDGTVEQCSRERRPSGSALGLWMAQPWATSTRTWPLSSLGSR